MLQVKHNHRNEKACLLHNCHRHQPAIPYGISRHHQKSELPCNSDTGESVVVLWMSNRRRVVASRLLFHEVERQQRNQSINTGQQESKLGEFHVGDIPPELTMNLSDIKRLLNYTEWANNLALDAAARLPDEGLRRDFGISHGSIFGTLVHMAGAEWIWVERWHGHSPAKAEAWSLWSTESCADLPALTDRWGAVVDKRTRFVSELNEEGLGADL